jgi:ABC-type Fe3+-hydroxamate transport system substrate-binding protein
MIRRIVLLAALLGLLTLTLLGCGGSPTATPAAPKTTVGAVQLSPRPATLEGKTVVLRWNGKPNGDKMLNTIADVLTQKVKDVKIIKLYETDPSTVEISKDDAESAAIADKIAALKPDLVIASQGD